MSSEPKLKPGKYSMFLLHDDGTWKQPTVRTKSRMTESEICNAALDFYNANYHRGYFIAVGFDDDEACPDDQVRITVGGL